LKEFSGFGIRSYLLKPMSHVVISIMNTRNIRMQQNFKNNLLNKM